MGFVVKESCRLDKFLADSMLAHSRSQLAEAVKNGLVRVDGHVVEKPSAALKPGQEVEVALLEAPVAHNLEPVPMRLIVPYEDEHLLVVDKPRGLATHPAASLKEPSLVNALLARGHSLSPGSAPYRPGIVHRLDKPTTGLLVVAKTESAHRSLARAIEQRTVSRTYLAVVRAQPDQPAFTIDAPVGRHPRFRTKMAIVASGKHAVTHVRLTKTVGEWTLLAARLETGRTHQVRVHLASIGIPVVGDPLYGDSRDEAPLQLHSCRLVFEHPVTKAMVSVYAGPPGDFLVPVKEDEL